MESEFDIKYNKKVIENNNINIYKNHYNNIKCFSYFISSKW